MTEDATNTWIFKSLTRPVTQENVQMANKHMKDPQEEMQIESNTQLDFEVQRIMYEVSPW